MSAPPAGERDSGLLPEAPACPFCLKDDTELMNAFGSHASVSTYWCTRCASPFELFKWRGRGVGTQEGPPGSDPGGP